jgi:predicted secreted protein
MMTPKSAPVACAAAFALACASANAQAPQPMQPSVTVSASATATITNDRLQAWLRAEAENPNASAAASQVNAAIGKALADAKAFPSLKVASAGYSTYQVSDKAKAQRWHVVQTISIDASDFNAAAAFITKMQDENGLLLSGMGFTVSEKARHEAEDSVTQQAIETWQERAQQAAQSLGFGAWRIGRVTVQTSDGGRVYPVARMQAMAAPAAAAPVALEAGTTDVTVNVSGDALLEQPRVAR